ncbi:YbaB/EbfC family nucleoid-associated protein [Crossiella sp. CA198]|uniref:YbaB/EbfC family nucleoid-associated protein n=1 Tax=Crossiella sp. CA198 TaxID=3455607 RepID=UPI003F8D39CE
MNASYDDLRAEALSAYQSRRTELLALRGELAAVSGVAKAPRDVVTVTVGPHGELKDIKFPTAAYNKLTPAELAAVILRTANAARTKATRTAGQKLGALLPAGLTGEKLLRGELDLGALLPEAPDVA